MKNRTAPNDAQRHHARLSRRLFLSRSASLAAIPLLGRWGHASNRPRFFRDPFQLGVASGDPDASGFVLWTRLAPSPLEPHGGLAPETIEVSWELAADEGMQHILRAGTSFATPQLGHSVHVELDGLQADRWYWYRFRAGDAESPIGRTRTLPAPDAMASRLRFAATSCQNFEQGLFTAYEQMKADDLDLVVHLGDYIYEHEAGRNGKVRTHLGPECRSLGDYRVRLSQCRADPLLYEMHATCPWIVTWDDHEFDNNYANAISEESGIDPAAFLERRANAYQAYYEMMPLRRRSLPKGPHLQLYRKASFGRLAEFLVLDTRQYRSDQPNGDGLDPLNDAALDPGQSILGAEQRHWLQGSLIASRARWNVLAQQVMMATVAIPRKNSLPRFFMDQWPGYAAEKMDLMRFVADRRVPNPVVLTGDIHSNWANEIRIDDRKPERPLVASEFVTTSLSSGGNGVDRPVGLEALYGLNPGVKYHNQERGYLRCTVTAQAWQSDYVVVDDVEKPGGQSFTRASFTIESGDPRIHRS